MKSFLLMGNTGNAAINLELQVAALKRAIKTMQYN